MTIARALRDGMRRVDGAPAILLGMYLLTLLLSLPLAAALQGMLAGHLGHSLAAEAAAAGVNFGWWQEFSAQAVGLGTTFGPAIIGFGATLKNVSDLLDNRPIATVIAGAAGAYLVAWAFFIGGILDRYARRRPTRTAGFFSACGVFFFRFVRLGVLAWLAYLALFTYVHAWLFDDLYPYLTRDFTVERSAFVLRCALYGVFGALLLLVNLVFDYAKVRAVVEDRRSMIGALRAGARFVARHAGATVGLYAATAVVFLIVIAAYALLAPGVWGAGWSLWRGLLIGQAYVLARLWVKLLFYGAETSLFQSKLAHAGYTAAPQPVWPESPAAETIANASVGSRAS
jgi:hypothetical protein